MEYVFSAAQHKAADNYTSDVIGIPSMVLMERAAYSMYTTLVHRGMDLSKVWIICGSGNNGGDGAAFARILAEKGYEPVVFLAGNMASASEQMQTQIRILKSSCYPMVRLIERGGEEEIPDFSQASLLVDAIFGIGLHRPVEGYLGSVIERMNAAGCPIIACDMPSGVYTDTGEVPGKAVKADMTITFTAAKPGIYLYPGAAYAGEVVINRIGIPVTEEMREDPFLRVVEQADLDALPSRCAEGNKGTFGKLLIIAGCKEMFGAAYLSARAALKSGAGMVKVYTHSCNRTPLASLLPEALLSVYEDGETAHADLLKDLAWADSILIGPGLGLSESAKCMAEMVIRYCNESNKPLVMDADALNILSTRPDLLSDIRTRCILTPHMGEMSRLTGCSIAALKADPIPAAAAFAGKYGLTLVMKDARTVIADPDGGIWLNTSGCSALATAGSGDVLAGITAAVLHLYGKNSGRTPGGIPAAALACYIHGKCGEYAAAAHEKTAVTAGELADFICI